MRYDASGDQSEGVTLEQDAFGAAAVSCRRICLRSTVLAACLGVMVSPAWGFQFQFQFQVDDTDSTVNDESGLVAVRDRDAESWLKRAEKAAAREDWKLAADTLARIISDNGDKTVSLDGEHFYSAGRCAQQQLQDWPARGIETYRVLYDGEAERLFNLGKQTHDLQPLRMVAYRYPQTTIGPAALDLLATWLLDRNEAAEAIDVLHSLSGLRHNRIPRFDILHKLAIAYTVTNQRQQAAEALSEMGDIIAGLGVAEAERKRDRLEAVQRFFEATKFAGNMSTDHALFEPWSQLLGPPGACGRSPPIDPVITSDIPWRETLPGADRADVNRARKLIERTGRPPVWQAVTDGSMLFVSTPGGIVARDLSTFEFVWQSIPGSPPRDPRIDSFRLQTGFLIQESPDEEQRLDALTTKSLYHEYAGAVTTAKGLVFAIDQSETAGEIFPDRKRGRVPENNACTPGENSLRAFEAVTGRSVWTKGRAGPVEDELKEAHFFSTPVAAGSYLVAPYENRHELFLAVIKPDGTLVRKISLGSGRPGMLPFNAVLQPTVVDGTIFVPTGGGLLIALNAADFSLRWLTTYPRSGIPRSSRFHRQRVFIGGVMDMRAYSQPDGWLCSPPVVAGGLILLTPHDGEDLFAFDRWSGEQRWRFDRGRHRYLVGVSDGRVILAGRKVTAVDLETGKAVWSYDDHRPTGRPALSGDRVLVPTDEGLLLLDVDKGKPIGDIARSETDLGNLLVTDGALYSITIGDICKYPDPKRTRELAERRLAKNPNDYDAVVRLAWIAGLENDWQRALDLIEPLAPANDGARSSQGLSVDPALRERIAHLRVSALLALADEAAPDRRGDLLQRAVSAARRSDDVVQAGLTYCDSLAEQGDPFRAGARAMEMLVEVGDEPVTVEKNLESRASVLIAERLRRFDRAMSDEDKAVSSARFREILNSVLEAGRTEAAEHLADAVPSGGEGARADLKLAGVARAEGRLESAVFHLERAARRAPDSDTAAEALATLALLLAAPGDDLPAAPAQAMDVRRELRAHYSGRPLPQSLFDALPAHDGKDVDAFVAAFERTRKPGVLDGAGSLASPNRRGRLRVEYADWEGAATGRSRLFDEPYSSDDCWDDVLPVRFANQVNGVHVGAEGCGTLCWSSEIDTEVERPSAQINRMAIFPGIEARTLHERPVPETNYAAIAGRVAALDVGEQIHAIGLTTGRLMWRPLAIDRELGRLPKPSVIAVEGMVIAATDAHTLVGVPARQDAKPRWRRRFDKRRMGRMAKVGGLAVVVDLNAEWLWVVDPSSGRTIREFALRVGDKQIDSADSVADEEDPDAHVAIVGGAVCRNGLKRVVARDIVTGRVLWEKQYRSRIKDLIALDEHHVGVSDGFDLFAVVRVETGETLKEIEVGDLELPPIGATLDWPEPGNRLLGGRLLVFGRTDDDPPKYKIVSFGLDDSEKREDGPYDFAMVSPRMLTASSAVLPVILYDVSTRDAERDHPVDPLQAVRLSALVLLDKSNLEPIGQRFVFDEGGLSEAGGLFGDTERSKAVTDVLMLGDRLVAVTPDGFCVLARSDPPQDVPIGMSGRMEAP